MNFIANLVLRRPWTIIIGFILLCIGAQQSIRLYGTYDFSVRQLTPLGSVGVRALDEYEALFGATGDSYLLAFTEEEGVFNNETLGLIERITERIDALPGTESVVGLANVKDIRGSDSGLDVEEFIGELPLDPDELEQVAALLHSDPIVAEAMLSKDGRTAAFVARLIPDALTTEGRRAYFDQLDALLAEVSPDTEFYIAGLPHLFRTMQNHVEWASSRLLLLTNVIFGILIWYSFGQRRMAWMALLPIYIAAMLTIGSLMLSGRPMTVLTAPGLLATLIMVIGMCDGIHLIDRFRQEVVLRPDAPRFEPLVTAIQHVGAACFLTSMTTAVGFSGLIASKVPTVSDFGLYGSLGVAYAFLTAVLLLPACIVVVERRWKSPPPPLGHSQWTTRVLEAVGRLVAQRPGTIVLGGVIILVSAATAIPHVRSELRWTDLLKPSDAPLVAQRLLDQSMAGSMIYPVLIKGAEPGAVKDPKFLRLVEEVQARLMQHEPIGKVVAPTDYLRKMHRALSDDPSKENGLPTTRDAVAQNLLLFEMAGGDNEFDRLTTYDYDVVRLMAYAPELSAAAYDELDAVVHAFDGPAREIGAHVYLSGVYPARREGTTDTLITLVTSLAMALPIVFVVLMIAFRSVRLGLISVLPNLLPIATGMGMLGMTDIPLNQVTVVAFPIAFGLAVDDTIHFLSRFNRGTKSGLDTVAAVQNALVGTGRAMVLSTLFLLVGFSVNFLAPYMALIDMTVVLLTVLVAAIIGDLLVLPALLIYLAPDRRRTF